MQNTTPIFVLGSGRCGTAMIARMLAGVPHIEAHHEFVRDAYQREASMCYMRATGEWAVLRHLDMIFGAACRCSDAKYFLDASNKLAWVAKLLLSLHPQAKFIHLVRDGRKVASSFFHKLADRMYTDRGLRALREWMECRDVKKFPPPNEEFWWVIPQAGQPWCKEFSEFDRFQKCCWHWAESNRLILEAMEDVPDNRVISVKLEALCSSPEIMRLVLAFVGVEYDESFMQAMQRPQHVYVPVDFPLTKERSEQFKVICGGMMERLGYDVDQAEYRVNYGV